MSSKPFTIFCALALVSLLLNGCVPSLHPLFTPETSVQRDEIIGMWKEKPDSDETWTFKKAEGSAYTLSHTDKDSVSEFEVRIVKLDEHLFLDLTPAAAPLEKAKIGEFYRAALIPGHLIMKAKIGGTLELQFLEPEELKKRLQANPKLIQHTSMEVVELLITAPTADLQKFYRQAAADAKLWTEATVMRKQLL